MSPSSPLTAQTASTAALATLLHACADEFDLQLAVFLSGDDAPDAARKARVALRRLTTLLDAFARLLRKKATRKLRRRAKDAFRLLGKVRDAEVTGAAGPDLREKVCIALRKSAAQELGARLRSPRLLSRLLAGGKTARRLQHMPLAPIARDMLDAARDRCLTYERDLSEMSQNKIHALRKDLKSWRYLVEFLAPCWPEDPQAGEMRAAFQDLQDALGVLTDHELACPAGLAVTPLDPEMRRRATILWQALAAWAPWWRSPDLSAAVTKTSSIR